MIVAPHGAGRDADLAGVVVAAPDNGTSALLINPVGVVSKAKNEAEFAIYPDTFKVSCKDPVTGYDGHGEKNFPGTYTSTMPLSVGVRVIWQPRHWL